MDGIIIRYINDYAQIHRILDTYKNDLPPLNSSDSFLDNMANKLTDNAIFIVCELNEVNLGFAAYYANNAKLGEAYISLIAVNSNYRCNGVGSVILNSIIENVRKLGYNRIKLEVSKDNINGINFYKKNGFVYLKDSGVNSQYMINEI